MSQYTDIEYIDTIEYEEKYIVAIMTKPFFLKSQKTAFVNTLIGYIANTFNIDENNIIITFNIDTIYMVKNAKTKQDIKNIFDKVCQKVN